jgi:predicted ATPase/DNA-binding winged helix-turn-helix (wHTH) protein
MIEFGSFRVLADRREILRDGQPVQLGARAFDLLLALVEARGSMVTKDALLQRVWPGRIVEEGNLQAQVSALRRALGDDRDMIRTIPGRGYQFVGHVRNPVVGSEPTTVAAAPPLTNLPLELSDLIGRQEQIEQIATMLSARRLVTLTGTGGIGKTRLALGAAQGLLSRFPDGVWICECAALVDATLVPAAVATGTGIALVGAPSTAEAVARALASKQILLVLDNCEHLIGAAAEMAEALLHANPAARVLATSREPLLAESEYLYRVPPLATPMTDAITAEEALAHGAVALFVARARAAGTNFVPARDLSAIVTVCRHLDGIPLAIELVAARAAELGIGALTALDDRLSLLARRRTASPRHQTLQAALDWSHDLLSEGERKLLRSLAVFAGGFTLHAAGAVIADPAPGGTQVVEAVANLVQKSLVVAELGRSPVRYRLLETTRIYAGLKLTASGDREGIERRHACYYRDLLAAAEPDDLSDIDNLRAALAWAYGDAGDSTIGAALTVGCVPLWLSMSSLNECRAWTARAIDALNPGAQDSSAEMVLQTALGLSLVFTAGMTDDARAALDRALVLAERLGDPGYLLRAVFGLWLFRIRVVDFPGALSLARRCEVVAHASADPAAATAADWLVGISLHYLGQHREAAVALQRSLERGTATMRRDEIIRFGADRRVSAGCYLAYSTWIQGYPDRAAEIGRRALAEARAIDQPVSLCLALAWPGSAIALHLGDLATAATSIAELIQHAERHGLVPYHAYAMCMQGALEAARGDLAAGITDLRAGLARMRAASYYLFYTNFLGTLGECLGRTGEFVESVSLAEEAVVRSAQNQETWCRPELLRIKGELEWQRGARGAAEALLRQALDEAGRQGALAWELRAARSLAQALGDTESLSRLATVYARFTEGFATADLGAAKALLGQFERRAARR